MHIRIFTTGGTIDKLYFDAKSDYQIGAPVITDILAEMAVNFSFEVTELFRKDSLELNDQDRARVHDAVAASAEQHILITHGTDTMTETGKVLLPIPGKTIVLTGAMQPAKFKDTDAVFNIGCAIGALQSLPPGVYIAMSGRIFPAESVRKNRALGRFESAEAGVDGSGDQV